MRIIIPPTPLCLSPVSAPTSQMSIHNLCNQEEYEVEEILDSRFRWGKLWYLVKFLGWSNSDNMWLPYTVITHSMVLTHSTVLLALAAVHGNVKIAQNKHCIKATYGYICVKLEVYTMCSCSSERV